MNRDFSTHLTKYFGEYLPQQRGVSVHTLRSYRDTFVQVMAYMEHKHKLRCGKLSLNDFTCERIQGFLDYLGTERNVSPSTVNQRLAAIHSFFKYVQKREPSFFSQCNYILKIEFKNAPEPSIEYLRIDEMQFLFTLPDLKGNRELRDLAVLVTLYETGARVQELIDLRLGDVSLKHCPTAILNGKGGKIRTVPLGGDVASILRMYIKKYAMTEPDQHLFVNGQNKCLSRMGVQYIINKYVERGRKANQSMFKKKISNHTFRHSKSMHLLEAGVNLLYIRDFLGHTSVTTTEVYAKANPEIKRKTIEQHCANLSIPNRYTETKKNELLDWLKTAF